MAAVIAAVIVALLTFVIAAVVIGRESRRLASARRLPTYRLPDAVDWVGDRLPDEHAARLTPDELTTLLRWHIEHLQEQAIGGDQAPAPAISDDPGVVYLVRRATDEGLDVEVDTIGVVVGLQLDYLAALGALRSLGES